MTPEDISRALIEAYELGREHGYTAGLRSAQHDKDFEEWYATRDRLLKELEEKATL